MTPLSSPRRVCWIAASGARPGVAGLPNCKGALVISGSGNDIYGAVEVY
ncbi:hypothetical protein WMF38_05445 [Sorangium sp. So ce118]